MPRRVSVITKGCNGNITHRGTEPDVQVWLPRHHQQRCPGHCAVPIGSKVQYGLLTMKLLFSILLFVAHWEMNILFVARWIVFRGTSVFQC